MNQAVGGGLNPAIGAVGISRRPISRALDFAGLDRAVADRRAREQAISEGESINKRFERMSRPADSPAEARD